MEDFLDPLRHKLIHNASGLWKPANEFPSAPGQGDLFYETDTDKLWAWNGTAWVELARSGAWTNYTPALIATTTNPTLGVGAQQFGRWTRMGRTINGWASIKFGTSGTAAGTGNYRITGPVPAAFATTAGQLMAGGGGYLSAPGGDTIYLVNPYWDNQGSGMGMILEGGTVVSEVAPGAWTINNELRISFCYEAAAST